LPASMRSCVPLDAEDGQVVRVVVKNLEELPVIRKRPLRAALFPG
jgi:hypothetical protein